MPRFDLTNGVCPNCGQANPVGTPCATEFCVRRAYHCIPKDVVDSSRGPLDPNIGTILGDQLLIRALGQGGFGAVYLALQAPLWHPTAVKRLFRDPDADVQQNRLAELTTEARALASLSHPNIVRLIRLGEDDVGAYLVMEYVEGAQTLKTLLRNRALHGRPLRRDEARNILGQLLDALEAAHGAHIIHRDIKPENLMIAEAPGHPLLVKVVDFGLAKDISVATHTHLAAGTPLYMAPEQVRQRHIGPWTDLYAVGVIAYELLLGQRPYPMASVEALITAKLNPSYDVLEPAQRTGPLPDPVARFFSQALAISHEQRFPSVEAFRAGLDEALSSLDLSPRAASEVNVPADMESGSRASAAENPSASNKARSATGTPSLVSTRGNGAPHIAKRLGKGYLLVGLGAALALTIALVLVWAFTTSSANPSETGPARALPANIDIGIGIDLESLDTEAGQAILEVSGLPPGTADTTLAAFGVHGRPRIAAGLRVGANPDDAEVIIVIPAANVSGSVNLSAFGALGLNHALIERRFDDLVMLGNPRLIADAEATLQRKLPRFLGRDDVQSHMTIIPPKGLWAIIDPDTLTRSLPPGSTIIESAVALSRSGLFALGLKDDLEVVAALFLDPESAANTANTLKPALSAAATQGLTPIEQRLVADLDVSQDGPLVVARTRLNMATLRRVLREPQAP